MKKLKIGIIGGSGYTGGEVLRILAFHPKVKITYLTSERLKGQKVSQIHPNLRGLIDLDFSSINDIKDKVDVLFICLPNGVSMNYIDKFISLADKIIDCGADFRLEDDKVWLNWYKIPHQRPEYLKKFVYGLPELNRERIKESNYVAIPGCEATVSLLTLYPLVALDLIKPYPIIIDAKMSSSQSGKNFSLATHHPERTHCVRSYLPSGHRHTAEIEMFLSKINKKIRVDISATAIDMVRGILVTIHCFLKKEIKEKDIWLAYRKYYKNEYFIRLVKQKTGIYRYPEPKILWGTNYCDIGFDIDKRSQRLILIGAIDNLVRGTAGQAVQCLNIMYNWPENLGLEFSGLHPI
ncbi:MAG: N-acetyl-gamma-glutamyl-phosphate reductase [Patescibacteria group bacterium]|nr:MAG: N-acetyl-gamma-glutamyl-phosphate reductase [Patescibacteria group bacterium]